MLKYISSYLKFCLFFFGQLIFLTSRVSQSRVNEESVLNSEANQFSIICSQICQSSMRNRPAMPGLPSDRVWTTKRWARAEQLTPEHTRNWYVATKICSSPTHIHTARLHRCSNHLVISIFPQIFVKHGWLSAVLCLSEIMHLILDYICICICMDMYFHVNKIDCAVTFSV